MVKNKHFKKVTNSEPNLLVDFVLLCIMSGFLDCINYTFVAGIVFAIAMGSLFSYFFTRKVWWEEE